VNHVYLPLTSATQARPIIVRVRIAQRSLAVWALAELDTPEQEFGSGSPVAHALINQRLLAAISESGLAPHSLSLRLIDREATTEGTLPLVGSARWQSKGSVVTRKRAVFGRRPGEAEGGLPTSECWPQRSAWAPSTSIEPHEG
jgi:hypothetical protein